MSQIIAGGCACGAIRYETSADPTVMVNCHCRDCQRAGGSAYAPVIIFETKAVKLSGEPRYYKTVGLAGNKVERGFCATCGSQVAVKLARFPNLIGFQAGSLDDPSRYRPRMDIFTASAWAWDHMHTDTEKRTHGFAE